MNLFYFQDLEKRISGKVLESRLKGAFLKNGLCLTTVFLEKKSFDSKLKCPLKVDTVDEVESERGKLLSNEEGGSIILDGKLEKVLIE